MGWLSKKEDAQAGTAASASPASTPPQPVPGWSAYTTLVDGQPRWYYVNNTTGVSSWTLPEQPQQRASSASSSAYMTPWERRQNEFVKKYYNRTKGGGYKDYKDDPRYKNVK